MFGNGEIESEDLNTKNLGIYNVMQDDVADIGFSTVFATLRGSIRETHLHVSSLVPWSTRRRGYRHTKDAAMANPAARAIFLLIGPVPTLMTPAAKSPYGAVIGISAK